MLVNSLIYALIKNHAGLNDPAKMVYHSTEISKWVKLTGKEPEFVNGLRVTDAATMEIAEMVLSKVNKGLVQMMQKLGLKAVGISGKDGGLMTCKLE